jgi:hypothetical protein
MVLVKVLALYDGRSTGAVLATSGIRVADLRGLGGWHYFSVGMYAQAAA